MRTHTAAPRASYRLRVMYYSLTDCVSDCWSMWNMRPTAASCFMCWISFRVWTRWLSPIPKGEFDALKWCQHWSVYLFESAQTWRQPCRDGRRGGGTGAGLCDRSHLQSVRGEWSEPGHFVCQRGIGQSLRYAGFVLTGLLPAQDVTYGEVEMRWEEALEPPRCFLST